MSQRVPVGVGDLGRVQLAQTLQRRGLHGGRQDRQERHQVGVGTRMRLHVHVLGAEQLAAQVGAFGLDRVDVVATGVESVSGIPLGVLVGEEIALGELHGERAEILAGDQLEIGALVGELLGDRVGDRGRDRRNGVQRGQEGRRPGVDAGRIGGGKIPGKQATLSHCWSLQIARM